MTSHEAGFILPRLFRVLAGLMHTESLWRGVFDQNSVSENHRLRTTDMAIPPSDKAPVRDV